MRTTMPLRYCPWEKKASGGGRSLSPSRFVHALRRLRHNGVVNALGKKAATVPAMSPSDLPVEAALGRASGPRRAEADELLALFAELTGEPPVVWAGRIVGFGEVKYRYESGHGGRMPLLAFATGPREHTIYLETGFAERWTDLLERLGKHRASKACLYLTRLSDADQGALRELLQRSLEATRASEAAGS